MNNYSTNVTFTKVAYGFLSFRLVYFLASKNAKVEYLFKVNSEFVSTKSTNFKYTNQNTRHTNHNT